MKHGVSQGKSYDRGFQIEQTADVRPVCVICSKNTGNVVRFFAKRNGVFIPYGHRSAQAGDLWTCPICLTEIVWGLGDYLEKPVSKQAKESDYAVL